MLNIKTIVCGELNEKCYLVWKNNDKIILIDPGDNYEEIIDFISKNCFKEIIILLTHGHFDHIACCKKLQDNGAKIYIHELDAPKCESGILNLSVYFGSNKINRFKPSFLLSGEYGELNLQDTNIKFLHTPGHSEGSVCYIIDNNIFTGDTVFHDGYGRFDFYDGSAQKLRQSIKKINTYLKQGYKIYPGH